MNIWDNIVRFFQGGGEFMFPIALVFVVGLAIALERYVYLVHAAVRNRGLWNEIVPLLSQGNFRQVAQATAKSPSAIGHILNYGLARIQSARRRDDIEKAMEESLMEVVPRLEKRTHYLATFANLATLLGLLGTVMGLIRAFAAVATVKPAELLLVPMIDIFTVLVTFLLMTAVFSRTVILQLNLPPPQTEFKEPPPGLQLEVMVRKDLIQVADRNTGPLATLPNTPGGYNFDGLTDYLKRVKAKFPEKTEASILLEPDTPYDTLVQVMDRVRVFEVSQGLTSVQAELFPDISIGDAPELPPGAAAAPVAAAPVAAPTTPVAALIRAPAADASGARPRASR